MAREGDTRDINLWDIPLYALRSATRTQLASLLNSVKVLPSPNGLPRDWRGLAHLSGVPAISSKENPTLYVLTAWEKDAMANLGQLHKFLGEMDRWDIQDDIEEMLYEDGRDYLKRTKNDTQTEATGLKNGDADRDVLTVDDVCRLERGDRLQYYDAFLLYADEDIDFAMEMVEKLENDYGLKLCYKDRDLIGGLTFEHEAIMRLIAERCQRLVIIVTKRFLDSPANKFFVTFAQALGIEQRQRKVIPCIYERCCLPVELSYYFPLDYNRTSKLWNFWDKLRDSLSVPNTSSLQSCRATIRELNSSEHPCKALSWKNTNKAESTGAPHLPCSQKSLSSSSSDKKDDESLKHFSALDLSDKKEKPKRFLEKIFNSKDNKSKKAAKKKTPLLEQ